MNSIDTAALSDSGWPVWRKVIFRFAFIYLCFQVAPWTWFDVIKGFSIITGYYYSLVDWTVGIANDKLFHIRAVLVPKNGSGDTSFGWAELCLYITLALIGSIIWGILDHKRR